jgi:hypothetical protein
MTLSPPPEIRSSAVDRGIVQLDELLADFDLAGQAPLARAVFAAICRRPLSLSAGERTAFPSRLNADGSPLQYATIVGQAARGIRFVADPRSAAGNGASRMRDAARDFTTVAALVGARAELASLTPLLDDIAPSGSRELGSSPAGVFWVGAAFTAGAAPRLRIYVNGAWGSRAEQRGRMRRFAEHFGRAGTWDAVSAGFPSALAPLGLAVTVARGEPLRGALYLRAFGIRVSEYAALARAAAGAANADQISAFGAEVFGAHVAHPTPSAALSFAFGPEPALATELEFCTHCLYRDDSEARDALEAIFAGAGVNPAPYRKLVRALAPPNFPPGPPRFHAFFGASARSGGYSVYLNPALS